MTTARCGSQRMIRAPIETSLSTKNSRLSNIFSKISTVPRACVATITAIEVRSAGNAGHGPSSIFGIWPPRSSWITSSWLGRHAQARALDLDVHAEPLEDRQDRREVLRLDAVDRDVAAGDGREADEAADLDVLGADPPLAAGERLDALDAQHVRLDALDLRAERDEEAAEILDVRLAGGVADHRLARRQHGGHDRVLGRHHARLVEEDVLAAQAGRAQLEAVADVDLGAELGEGVDVRVEPPPADHVAARRRHAGPAEAREQRAGEQERGADLARRARHRARARRRRRRGRAPRSRRSTRLRRRAPEISAIIVSTSRIRGTLREHDRLAREQARGEHRQGAVLVPGGTDPAAQGLAALDHEGLGEGVGDGGLGHARRLS